MGVFANTSGSIGLHSKSPGRAGIQKSGLVAWLLDRLHRSADQPRRLALVERISLAPRQTLALIEADGQRFLIVTSAEGVPAFHPLNTPARVRSRSARSGEEGKRA